MNLSENPVAEAVEERIDSPAEEPEMEETAAESGAPSCESPVTEPAEIESSAPSAEEMPTEGGSAEDEPAEDEPAEDEPAEEDTLLPRLAEEFLALADEMEGITLPEDLPDEVWETAAQGVPLRDAYLRFWYAEHTRRQAAIRSHQQSAAATAGSLRDLPDDPRPEEAAFARFFQTAVE